MAALNKFNGLGYAIAKGIYDLRTADFAFYGCTTEPDREWTTLSDFVTVWSGLVAGLGHGTLTRTNGVAKLVIPNITITSDGTTQNFQYGIIAFAVGDHDLIGWIDYGELIDMTAGKTLRIKTDQTKGILTIS